MTFYTRLGLFTDGFGLRGDMYHTEATKNRKWRTSLFSGYASNIVIALYACDKSGMDKPLDQVPLYFQVLVNEVPVAIKGCKSSFCEFSILENKLLDFARRCKFSRVCKRKPEKKRDKGFSIFNFSNANSNVPTLGLPVILLLITSITFFNMK